MKATCDFGAVSAQGEKSISVFGEKLTESPDDDGLASRGSRCERFRLGTGHPCIGQFGHQPGRHVLAWTPLPPANRYA